MNPSPPPYSPNVVNQTVDYQGRKYRGQPGGQWEDITQEAMQQQASSDYQQGIGSAVQTLRTQSTNLGSQYGDLLKTVTGEYQPLINQTTQTANAELGRRGLTPDSTLYQQQVQGALQPVYGAEAANAQQIGAGSISDVNSLAAAIANIQAGGAGTASQLPLQYGSLSLSAQALPAQIGLAQAQAQQAQTGARYIPIPNVGVYDLQAGKLVGGGIGASTQAQTGVSGLFKYVP